MQICMLLRKNHIYNIVIEVYVKKVILASLNIL